jgi:hypothetical protein
MVLAAFCPCLVCAQLSILADQQHPAVFGGIPQNITVRLHNAAPATIEANLRARLYQASSATAAPLATLDWKTLRVLPGQTVLDSVTLTLPQVRAESRFLVQWLDETNRVLGVTEVVAYPTNLLQDLKPLATPEPLGLWDPLNQLKPLLKTSAVAFQDLEEAGCENYAGKLAIIGPFQSSAQMPAAMTDRAKALAQRGVAVLWIQPPTELRAGLKPSFYTVPAGKGAVVVAQAEVVSDLPHSPQAQLNLIQLAWLATHPEPPRLPSLHP